MNNEYVEYMLNKLAVYGCTQGHNHTCSTSPATPEYLDICKTTDCPPATKKAPWKQKANQEEVTPMASYASATVVSAESIEASQRSVVRDTLYSTVYKIKSALKKEFGMVDDDAPRTAAELIKRITDGQYTVDKEYIDYETYGAQGAVNYIRWRDPKVVEDKAGYKAARAQLEEAYEDAKLKAALLPVADLLQLVEDFKAWKHA
jgi:hypothetical protein